MPQHFDVTVNTNATSLDELASPSFDAEDTRGREVLLFADSSNNEDILWGDAATQNMILSPGDERIVPVERLGEIFVRVLAATESLHCAWIA